MDLLTVRAAQGTARSHAGSRYPEPGTAAGFAPSQVIHRERSRPVPSRCPMSINFVTAMAVKSFDVPDKKRCPDKAEFDLCTVNDYSVARLILGPGWRWSVNTRPYERTDVCLHHHLGFCISGEMEVETAEGLRSTIHANDTYAIPPGHDEWVVGPNPFVAVEFLGAASFGRSGARGVHARI